MKDRENFYVENASVEVRESSDGATKIVGEAIVFERESNALYGEFVEVIKAGALDEAKMDRVIARTNHDSSVLLGTTMGGTLRMSLEDGALKYEVDIPNTTAGRDTAEYIKRGDISGSSFAFTPDYNSIKWIDRSTEKKLPIREIHKIQELYDVSPVINPAYPSATTGLRDKDQALAEFREFEKTLQKDQRAEDEKRNLKAKSDTALAIHSHNKKRQS